MNILILTPTHPIQIAEMINFISKYNCFFVNILTYFFEFVKGI